MERCTTAGHLRNGIPSFLIKPEPITDIAETYDYDVVVVGAGAAGVPAALSAREAGASVALLQKQSMAVSQGNSGSGIDLTTSDPADVQNLVSQLIEDSQHRPNRNLVELWAMNSGEAVKRVIEKSLLHNAPVIDQGNQQHNPLIQRMGYHINFVTSFFGPKPQTTGDGMRALAEIAADEGVEIYYSTPGVQLVQDDSGAVTGIIARREEDGTYLQFNATKGVIMTTGDYQCDEEMLRYYQPDMTNFTQKQQGKTGDGHKMVVWAGGKIEDLAHTKMLHDFDAGPASMGDMPFLAVKQNGKRFVNETVEMSLMNNYLRSKEGSGWYSQIFDSNYMTACAEWPGALVDPEGLCVYMPEEDVERTGVFPDARAHVQGRHARGTGREAGDQRRRRVLRDRQPLQRAVREGPGRGLRQAARVPCEGRHPAVLRHPPLGAHVRHLLRRGRQRRPPVPDPRGRGHRGPVRHRQLRRRLLRWYRLPADGVRPLPGPLLHRGLCHRPHGR